MRGGETVPKADSLGVFLTYPGLVQGVERAKRTPEGRFYMLVYVLDGPAMEGNPQVVLARVMAYREAG
jgi:hypothetical protein